MLPAKLIDQASSTVRDTLVVALPLVSMAMLSAARANVNATNLDALSALLLKAVGLVVTIVALYAAWGDVKRRQMTFVNWVNKERYHNNFPI